MPDKKFLMWLHQRLENVHGEHPQADYMHKLRAIIKATPDDQCTPNMGSGNCLEDIQYWTSNQVTVILHQRFQTSLRIALSLTV